LSFTTLFACHDSLYTVFPKNETLLILNGLGLEGPGLGLGLEG